MTYREAYFSLQKIDSKYFHNSAIKALLMDIGGYSSFYELSKHLDDLVKDEDKLQKYVKKLKNGEPLQYILGYSYFVNSNYFVTPDVLIPRQETEELAVGVCAYINRWFSFEDTFNLCDLCTGSGVLGIYLKERFPRANVVATDISPKALEVARRNAKEHNVDIELIEGDFLKPILDKNIKFDVLVCNPPYIKDESTVDPQTLKYEPHLALFGNPPTKYYLEIFKNIDTIMKPDCILAFEIGEEMEEELTNVIEKDLPGVIYKFQKDIYNKTRFLYIIRKRGK